MSVGGCGQPANLTVTDPGQRRPTVLAHFREVVPPGWRVTVAWTGQPVPRTGHKPLDQEERPCLSTDRRADRTPASPRIPGRTVSSRRNPSTLRTRSAGSLDPAGRTTRGAIRRCRARPVHPARTGPRTR